MPIFINPIGLLIWCAVGYVAGRMAAKKGYPPNFAFFVAFLLGPIALLLYASLPTTTAGIEQAKLERKINQQTIDQDRTITCPNCHRIVSAKCPICPRCDYRFAN